MEKISQLIDGHLGHRESEAQIKRLERDPELSHGWNTYHLIGDALRNEVDLGPGFTRRLRERLEAEPVVIAPHMRLSHRVTRYTLPLAAGVAGVTLVAWLALSFQTPGSQGPQVARSETQAAQVAKVRAPAATGSPANGGVGDYLMAHQEFSPSTAMHGVASYVRTVSAEEPNGAR